ncbi:MAG: DUF4111 domain-containing protein, partial [Anaerolineae bacterium]|nr:DUF4111 domain-containing protein [Anaerolineae bacterium]
AAKVEGAYIPKYAIRRYASDDLARPCVNEGEFYLGYQGSDWIIQRYILREFGVVIAGPDPKTLIDVVTIEEIQHAVELILHEWWAPMLDEPERMLHSDYQVYAILSMCRALHTLHTGKLSSKPVAARWALDTLEQQWAESIELALSWRDGKELDMLDQSLALIRYALEQTMIYQS